MMIPQTLNPKSWFWVQGFGVSGVSQLGISGFGSRLCLEAFVLRDLLKLGYALKSPTADTLNPKL